jgi:hypothetical protein
MRATVLCVSSTLALASCVVVNENKSEATTPQQVAGAPNVRGALSGQRQLLVSFYSTPYSLRCRDVSVPAFQVPRQMA